MAVALFHFISLVQVLQRRLCDVDTSISEGKSKRNIEILVRYLYVLADSFRFTLTVNCMNLRQPRLQYDTSMCIKGYETEVHTLDTKYTTYPGRPPDSI